MSSSRLSTSSGFSRVINADLLSSFAKSARNLAPQKVILNVLCRPLEDALINSSGLQHWVLRFEFEDQETFYLEANNCDGVLVPSVSDEKPQNVTSEKKVGEIQASRYKIFKLAFENKLNNKKYNVLEVNCQKWVEHMLQQLGINEIPLDTVAKDVFRITAVLSAIFGIPGLLVSLGSLAIFSAVAKGSSASTSNKQKDK